MKNWNSRMRIVEFIEEFERKNDTPMATLVVFTAKEFHVGTWSKERTKEG